ncbi:MAG: glycerophosphodiester phosphodiesterase family protein [Actinomycetes bacterium]
MHPFLRHSGPIPMVHRGAPMTKDDSLVENTEAAFQRAYDLGFRYFETDVHATKDHVVVTSHDNSLRRVAGERVRVDARDWTDLASVRVGGRPLPRLIDLLDVFPDVRFNVDPKADSAVRPLVDVLRSRDALDRVCVASFSDRRLRWIRAALGEQVCTAAGPREIRVALSQLARGADIWIPGVDVLQVPRLLSRARVSGRAQRVDLVAGAQRAGIPIHVWTVNDEAEMEQLIRRGVDGVMSDDVEALVRVFSRHGWQPAGHRSFPL